MRLVDLSHPFEAAGADGSKRMEMAMQPLKSVHEHGVTTHEITFFNHAGTHVDAPAHLIHGGKTVDRMPLDAFYGPGVVLDIPLGPNGAVGKAELEKATPEVKPGDAVFICTGWGDKIYAPDYASHHPYLTEDGAAWLVAKRARMVGMDVQSVDLPHSLRTKDFKYTSLRILLKAGIPAVHNLCRLEEVRGKRAKLLALPINFLGADGSPARVVAEVD